MKMLCSALMLSALAATDATAQAPRVSVRRIEAYQSVTTDPNGNLLIIATDHRRIVIPKGGKDEWGDEQTSFERAALSPNRRAVGALAVYYLPRRLIVYANRIRHVFTGDGAPILQWHFVDGGERVAFGQQPAHGSNILHWEMWDIEPERFRTSLNTPDANDCSDEALPTWVTGSTWHSK